MFINESKAEFDAVLTEEIAHRPAIDIGKTRSIPECDSFAFVERNRSRNALILVVFEVFADELAQRIALASEHASLDSTLDE